MPTYTSVPVGARGAQIWPRESQPVLPDDTLIIGPSRASIGVEDEPQLAPYDVDVEVELHNGKYHVVQLKVFMSHEHHAGLSAPRDSDEYDKAVDNVVATSDLDQIKLSTIVERGLRDEVTMRRVAEDGSTLTGLFRDEESTTHLVYLLAIAIGQAPRAAVAEHFNITPAAAAQRIARARMLGFLRPTRQGVAG